MKNERKWYLGLDVSKLWFDISVLLVSDQQKQPMLTERFCNTTSGLAQMDEWLNELQVPKNEHSLLVMENTGVYHRLIWEYCSVNKLPLHIGNAAQIKWSLGIVRGKSDTTDSQRLCMYCYKHAEDLKATDALDPVFLKLKDLITARSRLLSQLNSMKVYLNELKLSNDKQVQKMMETAHQAAMKGLRKSIQEIEGNIHRVIREHRSIQNNYNLLISIPGIGHLTAVYLLCYTNNFAGKMTGKQLASYAGVVPFSNTSGTSIKGRNKVHKMANKDLKKLLHLCAMTAVKNYPEFKNYYDRKKAEGKHSMTILNAIRNKLALRAVAVIKNQRNYVNNYEKAA
jgi:transposase